MYKKTVHFLRGSALAEVQCACPERVLNLLGSRGVVFWGLRWQSEICFRLWLLLPQAETLQEIGAVAGAEVTVLRRRERGPMGTVSHPVCAFGGVCGVLAAFIRGKPLYMGIPSQRQ